MSKHYFAADGPYGDAAGMIVIDTASWDTDDWDVIENVTDSDRLRVARELADAPWVDKNQLMFEF